MKIKRKKRMQMHYDFWELCISRYKILLFLNYIFKYIKFTVAKPLN